MCEFSASLIAWQRQHGRHDLPWQGTRDPYAIWVSEIMLQQTQVTTVIPYYRRFMASFPNIASLANTNEEKVLQHWSGLGYYSRARNLHQSAQIIMQKCGGEFPHEFETILSLPGIGRSTAAAISAFCFGKNRAILDGNVKRVLTRYFGIEGWPGQPKVEKTLWELAEKLLPKANISAYTQGLMDLGATLCTRGKPRCEICPLVKKCVAFQQDRTHELPAPKQRKTIPEKQITMLLIQRGREVLLEKRPSSGIWGGLWSLPEVVLDADFETIARQRFGLKITVLPVLPQVSHTFTHFRLHITPQPLQVQSSSPQAREPGLLWLDIEDTVGAALPSPIKKLLTQLSNSGAE